MINPQHFRELVVEPTLKDMAEVFPGADNPMAVELLMDTAAHESHMGTYLKQVSGPALGVYQMEPATHDDIWSSYITLQLSTERYYFIERVLPITVQQGMQNDEIDAPPHSILVTDLRYATVMARLAYYRQSFTWPDPQDPDWLTKLAEIWKQFYNTSAGKGTVSKFVADYTQRVGR